MKVNFRKNALGATLIEVIVASTIGLLTLGSALYVLNKTRASGRELMDSQKSHQLGLELADYLLATGRQATGPFERPCSRTPLAANLTCELQFSIVYGDGSPASLTFLNDSSDGSVAVEESINGGAWNRKFTYAPPWVRGLEICGDIELIAGTCAIRVDSSTRDKLELVYAANPNNRTFRFRVKLASSLGSITAAPDRYLTGAFYGRNPMPDLSGTDPSLNSLKITKQQ